VDPTVANGFSASFAALALSMGQQHQERLGRQSDATQVDNRGLNAGVFKAMTEADLAEVIAGLNTGSHAPTAQPYVVPNFVRPDGTIVK
jgi:hypothetical protein